MSNTSHENCSDMKYHTTQKPSSNYSKFTLIQLFYFFVLTLNKLGTGGSFSAPLVDAAIAPAGPGWQPAVKAIAQIATKSPIFSFFKIVFSKW